MSVRAIRIVWWVIASITALRFIFAAALPMTGDEAYYWEWSRHLAAGYIDHPPVVAYAVALFAWAGQTPFAVRFAFVLCGIGTTLAIAAAARDLWKRNDAAALAGLAATIAPMLVVLFVTVSPEGPASFAWALAICAAIRAFETRSRGWYALLGGALGLSLLSHFLCWALLAGVAGYACMPAHRRVWREGLWLSLAVCAVVYAPFLVWNAANGWASFYFALLHRHPSEVQLLRPVTIFALCALAFSPGLWIAAAVAGAKPRHALIAWTALPLAIGLLVLSVHERVEAYWFTGPFLSLCVALPAAMKTRGAAAWTFAPAALLTALLFAAGIAPFQLYGVAQHAGLHLRNAGPFEIFTYRELARRARAIAAQRGAIVMTDGYGFSALIDYYAGVQPVFIGYDAQGQEARRWYSDAARPSVALFVDKAPLTQRRDFQRQLAQACGSVSPGPTIESQYRTYYTTWCGAMTPDAISILRFSRPHTSPR